MSGYQDGEEFEYEEDSVRPPPRKAGSVRPTAPAGRVQPAQRAQVRPVARPQTAARNTMLYMGMGFMGAVIVGLLGIIAVLALQRTSGAGTGAPALGGAPTAASGAIAPAPNAGAAAGTPPRIALAEFKALYDNPAQRPVIVDVRAADAYAQGHIAGAISVPGSDLAAQLAKLPKDKLIVAYCQ